MDNNPAWTRFDWNDRGSVSSHEDLIRTPPPGESGFVEEVQSDEESPPQSFRRSRRLRGKSPERPVVVDAIGTDYISSGRDPTLEAIPTVHTQAQEPTPLVPGGVSAAPAEPSSAPSRHPENDEPQFHQVRFPEGAAIIRSILSASDTGAYSAEERLLLFLTFFFVTGFWCYPEEFAFPRLAMDMTALWDSLGPGGFRAAVAEIRRPDLHPSAPAAAPASAVVEPPINPEVDIFAELQDLNDAMLDYRDATESKTAETTRDTLVVDEGGVEPAAEVVVIPDEPPAVAVASIPDEAPVAEIIDDSESLPDTDIDDDPPVFDIPSELHQQAIDDGKEQMAMRAAIAQMETASNPDSDTESEREDEIKVADLAGYAAVSDIEPSGDELKEDAAILIDSDSEQTVDADDDIKHSSRGSPSSVRVSDTAVPARREGPQGRRRGYVMLAVDDGSRWAERATARASYWTQRLATMQRQGSLARDAWDGSPITARQWNDKTGSPALRALFTRDRLVEYQAYRREMLRGATRNVPGVREGPPAPPDQTRTPIPFDPKIRGSRKRKGGTSSASGGIPVPLPQQTRRGSKKAVASEINTNPHFKRGPVNMDDRMDFGSSMPTMTLRELLDKTNITKWTKKGQGLLEKAYHLLIVNPKGLPLVGDDSGAAHFMSTMTAKVCLRTMLFLANPSYGDPLLPGISNVVFQVGFEDIFNLFRAQPQFIPAKFIDLFTGSDSTYNFDSNKRWNKRDAPRKFASFVDTWTRKVLAFPDEFKQMVLMVNGFIQFQVADEAHSGLTVGKPESSILSLFNPDDMGGTVALLVNLGIPVDSLLEIITMIKLTFEENIDYFMRHALHRLTARQDR